MGHKVLSHPGMRLLQDIRKAGARHQCTWFFMSSQRFWLVLWRQRRDGTTMGTSVRDPSRQGEMGQPWEQVSETPLALPSALPSTLWLPDHSCEQARGVSSTSLEPCPNQLAPGPAQKAFRSIRACVSSGRAPAQLSTASLMQANSQ